MAPLGRRCWFFIVFNAAGRWPVRAGGSSCPRGPRCPSRAPGTGGQQRFACLCSSAFQSNAAPWDEARTSINNTDHKIHAKRSFVLRSLEFLLPLLTRWACCFRSDLPPVLTWNGWMSELRLHCRSLPYAPLKQPCFLKKYHVWKASKAPR